MVFKTELIFKQILFFFLLQFIVVASVASEVLIIENTKEITKIPAPGLPISIEYSVSSAEEDYQYYLLASFDQESMLLDPVEKKSELSGIKLIFELPAPFVSFNYQLLVKKSQQIIAQSELKNFNRGCVPEVKLRDVSADSDDLYKLAASLEDDYQNLQQAKLQLIRLKELMLNSKR